MADEVKIGGEAGGEWKEMGRTIAERGYDVSDPKWAHPELEAFWTLKGNREMTWNSVQWDRTDEEKKKAYEATCEYMLGGKGWSEGYETDNVTMTVYEAPGCPEEPDTPVRMEVMTPKNFSNKGKVIFYVVGGGIYSNFTSLYNLEKLCMDTKATIVAAIYRSSNEAPYPAQINDLHAGYRWMLEHAKELKINPNKVVIYGLSSGGHLGAALTFRLKRYQWEGAKPRGAVLVEPQTDDRCVYPSNQLRLENYDSEQMRWTMLNWLGVENFNSPLLGPEAFANRATVEDCRGLCPFFIHTAEMDGDRDSSMQFASKLYAAHVYTQIHVWGGAAHGLLNLVGGTINGMPMVDNGVELSIIERHDKDITGEILDCFRYDFRRPWLDEEK